MLQDFERNNIPSIVPYYMWKWWNLRKKNVECIGNWKNQTIGVLQFFSSHFDFLLFCSYLQTFRLQTIIFHLVLCYVFQRCKLTFWVNVPLRFTLERWEYEVGGKMKFDIWLGRIFNKNIYNPPPSTTSKLCPAIIGNAPTLKGGVMLYDMIWL